MSTSMMAAGLPQISQDLPMDASETQVSFSIFDTAVVLLGFVIFCESYAPVLLRHKAIGLLRKGGNAAATVDGNTSREFLPKLRVSLLRPLQLSVRRPIIQVMAFIMALEFGIYVLILSVYATLFIDRYNESPTIRSLQYIAIAIGAAIAAQGCGRLMDLIFRRLEALLPEGSKPTPEFRLPNLVIGAVLIFLRTFPYKFGIVAPLQNLSSSIT
jgi:hypothetical protein